MTKYKLSVVIALLALVVSCASKRISNIEPRDYQFEDDFMSMKWDFFLELKDCGKIDFLDSVMRPILKEDKKLYEKPYIKGEKNIKIDTLLVNKKENMYYWMFREIERITKRGPSMRFLQDYGYGGVTNAQYFPAYDLKDPLIPYLADYHAWKDSLNCE